MRLRLLPPVVGRVGALLMGLCNRRYCLIVAFLILLGPPLLAEAPDSQIFDQRVYVVGREPVDITAADMNNDGRLDLLTCHNAANYFSLLLGAPVGDFAPEIRVPPEVGGLGDQDYTTIVVADVNGDLLQDVVTRQFWGVSVYLGHGNGTFAEQVFYSTEEHSTQPGGKGIAIADFNRDQLLDIAIGSDPIGILLGYGNGTFAPRVDLAGAGGGSYLLAGDFTDDGHLDLIAWPNLWVGSGTGEFTSVPAPIGGRDAVAHDFNGDGRLDIATTQVNIFLATGNGTFGQPVLYEALEGGAWSITLADLNRDGKQDLVLSSFTSVEIAVLLSNGDGTFAPAASYPAPALGGWLASGDFNGDGRDDVAVASLWSDAGSTPSDKVSIPANVSMAFVMTGNGEGGFVDQRAPRVAVGEEPWAVASGDFNADGRPDIATANRLSNDVSIVLTDADGTLVELARIPVGVSPISIVAGRFNADPFQDLAVANSGSLDVSLLFGNGDGTFAPGQPLSLPSVPVQLVRGDFDSSGTDDLAALSQAAGQISVFVAGSGSFEALEPISVGDDPRALAVVDLDGQHGPDLAVVLGSTDEVSVLLGNGDGTFNPVTSYPSGTESVSGVVAGDLNGDGRQDLMLGDRGDERVVVLHGDGEGGLSAPTAYELGARAHGVYTADLNGDGRPDLVATHGSSGSMLSVLLGDEGGFTVHKEYAAEWARGPSLAVVDFSGDGLLDLVVGSYEADRLALLVNRTPTYVRFAADPSTLTWPRLVGTDAYNIYRGNLADLYDQDADGLPDAGYGSCRNHLDPDTTDTVFVDDEIPFPGEGYFYLMARVGPQGETDLGSTSSAQPRVPSLACP